MNIGKFKTHVSFLEPIFVSNDYGREEVDGYIYHDRRCENIPKHSKYYSMRFAGGNNAEGMLRVRKESFYLKCTKLRINDILHRIDSIIEVPENIKYYEIVYTEDVDDNG